MSRILRFIGLIALLSTPLYILHAYSHTPGAGAYIRLLMWCPAAAALLTLRSTGGDLASIGWRWPSAQWVALSCLIPVLYLTATYAVGWMMGGGTFFNEAFVRTTRTSFAWQRLPVWSVAPLFVIVAGSSRLVADAAPLGEEIGWRGFLVPALVERHGFVVTSLVSGLLWGLWHFPLMFINQPMDSSALIGAACFLATLTGLSFPMTWLRLRSGSVWSAALFHVSHNTFNSIALALLTPTARTPILMDETGVVMAAVGCLMAAIFWAVARRTGGMGTPRVAPSSPMR